MNLIKALAIMVIVAITAYTLTDPIFGIWSVPFSIAVGILSGLPVIGKIN